MSKRTVKTLPGVTGRLDVLAWFGVQRGSEGNRDLIVRRGELLTILEALERARRRNTWWRRLLRWAAGAARPDLNPVDLLADKRREMDAQ
jgi:hypothetical protein